jgi:hypothetical protein
MAAKEKVDPDKEDKNKTMNKQNKRNYINNKGRYG